MFINESAFTNNETIKMVVWNRSSTVVLSAIGHDFPMQREVSAGSVLTGK